MQVALNLSHRTIKRFNQFKNHADRIINSNLAANYMEFDGVNEYASIANGINDYNFVQNTNVFSISLWFKLDDYDGDVAPPFMGSNLGATLNKGFSFFYENRISQSSPHRLSFFSTYGSSGNYTSRIDVDSAVSDNNWHHVLITCDNSTNHMYIDGIDQVLDTDIIGTLSTSTSTYALELASYGNAFPFGFANMDEISMWDVALTQSEVTEIFNKGQISVDYSDMDSYAAGCVSYWAMGDNNSWDGTNWTITDEKGSNNSTSVNMEYEDLKPTETVTTSGSLSGSAKWIGGVLAPNGFIYGIPINSTTVLKIDPRKDTVTTFGSLSGDTNKWAGGILAPNGFIYCIPLNSTTILKIDPTDDSVTEFGSLAGTSKWLSAVLAPNGIIYGIPFSSTAVLKIDTNDDTITTFDSLAGNTKWYGGVLEPSGRYIYGIPYDSTTVLKIDTTDDSTSTFGSLSGSNKWTGCVLGNNAIYGIPFSSTTVLKIDLNDDTTSRFDSLSGTLKWQGGVSAPNAIYGIPRDSTTLLKIDTNQANDFNEDFLMSGYYNKF